MPRHAADRHPHLRRSWLRAIAILVVCAIVAVLLSFDAVYEGFQRLLGLAVPLIEEHPNLGGMAFVLLAAASAIMAFFSSALLVPMAVEAWGEPATICLLWLGWLLGGMCTYAFGHALRGPLMRAFGTGKQFEFYLQRIPASIGFPLVLLLQLALPSEIPGYLCGFLRIPPRIYLAALAIAEIPFAIGTVLIGDSVVERKTGWLLALGVAGAVFSLYALRLLHKRLDPR